MLTTIGANYRVSTVEQTNSERKIILSGCGLKLTTHKHVVVRSRVAVLYLHSPHTSLQIGV
jgi:hypothetical protein